VAITKGDNLVAFDFFMTVEANIIAALFHGRCPTVAMNDRRIP